jgi:ribosomal protein L12E/L44/L45/RPP1/RPP2
MQLPEGVPIHPASERPPSTHRSRTARLRAMAADATTPKTKAHLLELVRVSETLEAFDKNAAAAAPAPEADQAPQGAPPAGGGSR